MRVLIVLFLAMFFFLGVGVSVFAEGEKTTSPYVCSEKGNEYFEKYTKYKELDGDFSVAFEKLKKEYHEEMNDAFNEAIEDLSLSVYVGKTADVKACTPIHYVEGNNSLLQFQSKMQEKYRVYECALILMQGDASISATGQTFEMGVKSLRNQEFLLLDEINKSGVTLKMAMQNYAEMRQWYPVHRDLECLISQMEKYRNALRGFIDRVIIMPAKYYNYSSRYQ